MGILNKVFKTKDDVKTLEGETTTTTTTAEGTTTTTTAEGTTTTLAPWETPEWQSMAVEYDESV